MSGGGERFRITFCRKQFLTVEHEGWPDEETARVQAEATPALLGATPDADWCTPLFSVRVERVERID